MHVQGEDVDLHVSLGEQRRWLGGRGRNIPSFELFTSPDWRGTEGWIYCNQPLYRYGNLVKGIRLEFVDGRVVKASAEENEPVLTEMIATEGADRIGEFSLTDRRLSRITRFMAHTLYDENVGGRFGNTHIALGRSYQDAYDGDPARSRPSAGRGSASTTRPCTPTSSRRPTASSPPRCAGESERVIYRDGEFQLDGDDSTNGSACAGCRLAPWARTDDPRGEAVDATRRTHLASERTYLAWWRTGLTSLTVGIGAGQDRARADAAARPGPTP